jgi:hypothetical protein
VTDLGLRLLYRSYAAVEDYRRARARLGHTFPGRLAGRRGFVRWSEAL